MNIESLGFAEYAKGFANDAHDGNGCSKYVGTGSRQMARTLLYLAEQ
jgi:hypothetical protein